MGANRRTDLGDFLRSRRAALTPEETGVPRYGTARRVPGLRREEVALLAGMSVNYYTRLEQGENYNMSDAVVEALARALRMDETERLHLLRLAWQGRARGMAAHLRASTDGRMDDPRLATLVGELRSKSPDFARLWSQHLVAECSHAVREYDHPVVGRLTLSDESLYVPDSPGQRIDFMTA